MNRPGRLAFWCIFTASPATSTVSPHLFQDPLNKRANIEVIFDEENDSQAPEGGLSHDNHLSQRR